MRSATEQCAKPLREILFHASPYLPVESQSAVHILFIEAEPAAPERAIQIDWLHAGAISAIAADFAGRGSLRRSR